MTAIVMITLGGIAGYTVLSGFLGRGFAIPIGIIGLVSGAVVLIGPVGRALARKLEGAAPLELHEAHEATAVEIDDLRARMGELEERLDFAERLLAQGRQDRELAGGDQ